MSQLYVYVHIYNSFIWLITFPLSTKYLGTQGFVKSTVGYGISKLFGCGNYFHSKGL